MHARSLLADVPVDLVTDIGPYSVRAETEQVLALAIREAVTNALTHSRATEIHLSLSQAKSLVALRVRNDGVLRTNGVHGTGPRGIASRCSAIGGDMVAGLDRADHLTSTRRVPAD